MKSFSINKLTTGVIISLLAVFLVGCSTTSSKVEGATEIQNVAQPEKEAVQPKDDGSVLDVPLEEIVSEEVSVGEEMLTEESVFVIEEAPVPEVIPAGNATLEDFSVIVEEAPVAIEETPVVIAETPVVIEEAPVVIEETPVVIEETPVVIEKAPVVLDEAPVVLDEAPVVIAEAPVVIAGTPVVIEEAPVVIEEAPVVLDEAPVVIEETPVVIEETPVVIEETPVVIEETPVVIEEAPVVIEEAPVVIEETPVVIEEAPVVLDEAPVAIEETPVVIAEAPVAIEETPVVIEETPVVIEETPVVIEETPVEMDETPVVVEDTLLKEVIEYPLGINPIVMSNDDYPLFDLFIVHTADINGTLDSSEGSVGYARLSTMMQVARNMTDNILLIDAGNTLSGSLVNKVTNGKTSGALLYMLGYDVFTPQFSDYSFGDSALLDAAKMAKNNSDLIVLSANTLDSEGYLPFQPYQLYDFNGFKVCVVGLTGPFVQDGIGFTFDSDAVIQNAQYALDVASQYADYIIVVGSMDTVSSKLICRNLNGIDLFIDGSNSEVENGTIINGATIVNTEANMAEVGVVDIVVKNKEVSLVAPINIMAKDVNDPENSELASAYGIVNIPEDENISAYISSQKVIVESILSKPVANIAYSLFAADSIKSQSTFAKFFVKSLTESECVDASIISGGAFLQSIKKGDVSTIDINAAIDSNINICLTEMTGAQIYAALENGYATLPEGGQYFTQTDLKVIYNKYAKAGKRILRVKLGNKYIDKEATYTIATDSSLCNGENGFDMGTVVDNGDALNVSLYNMLVVKYPVK